MGIAKLYSQSGGNGSKINGIIQDYYVYAGENVEKGDFVELLTGSNGDETETQVRKATTSDIYGVAKTSGMGGDSTGHKDIVSIYTRIVKGDIIPKIWAATDDTGRNYIAPDGTKLTASSNASVVTNLPNALDGDASSYAEISEAYGINVIFPIAKKITKIKMKVDNTAEETLSCNIYGYKNASSTSFDAALLKGTDIQSGLIEYSFENTGYYEKYNFSFSLPSADKKLVRVYEIQASEYEI